MRSPTIQSSSSLIALALCASAGVAQSPPVNGITPSDVRWDAIEHATVVISPGVQIDDATVVMRAGWIVAVGPSATVVVPPGATTHDGRGKRVMAGFIEPALLLDSAAWAQRASKQDGAHWNALVTPQVSAEELLAISSSLREELRPLGFTVAAAYPDSGIFRGRGSVQLLGDASSGVQHLPGGAGEFVAFGRASRDAARNEDDDDDRVVVYPNSIMGAVALLRQTLHDARWRAESVAIWKAHPVGNDPPAAAPALDALAQVIAGRERVLFDASTELDALRSGLLAREFGLRASLLGSGTEFRHLNEVVAMKLPIIVPLDYPVAPPLTTARMAESASLGELSAWAAAPSNVSRLIAAGAATSLTTARLNQRSDFPQRVREALNAGLTESQLLAALTTGPAELLGMSDTLGTIAVGRMANLTVSDGPLFAKDSRITEVWIAGRAYDTAPTGSAPLGREFQFSGRFSLPRADQQPCFIVITPEKNVIEFEVPDAQGATSTVAAESVALDEMRGGFVVNGSVLGLPGHLRCTLRIDQGVLSVEALSAAGNTSRFIATAAAPTTEVKKVVDLEPARPTVALTHPFGDFGVAAVASQETVLFRDATLWTSSSDGILEHTDVIVREGVIAQIGRSLAAPNGGRVIDCAGRHITPGLIDCHSHTGLDGGVNEWTQACTAEVRINDVLDPDDVGWYRELAGGLTCANQLHGSANPIGGQNSVVKLKWGSPIAEWPAVGALPGIKFALGENVVRPKGRYPQTRMGVEAFMRDRFRSAREYRTAQKEYAAHPDLHSKKAAPRIDLELEALAEILEGKRIIHCHSYRQDEVLMLIRLADEFGFRIGTFQHILEGYKVADAIARHGAGGSCFSDWWAYKMEVMDAIPWAGAMMQGQGVLMSFNSDSNELARHMNTEAAKAVKYGNLSPARALEFVTINPARQLGLGSRTGSIEVGKDADLVVWSGDPLSPMSLCEQTWVEGTKRFDRSEDLAARAGRELLRQQLIVAALQLKPTDVAKPAKEDAATPTPPARLRARMMNTREDFYLDLWRRGLDLRSLSRAGVCGCDEGAP